MEFVDENIQQGIKKGLKSVTHMLYNEMYIYIWFICIYHVILVVIVLTNLVLLVKVSTRSSSFPLHSFSTFLVPSMSNGGAYNISQTSLETLNLEDLEKMASGRMA